MQLHPVQASYLGSQSYYRGFVGGRGAGKSWVGAYDMVRRAKPGRTYLAIAPTYKVLQEATFRELEARARALHFFRSLNRVEMVMTLGNGARVLGRSSENPDFLRGPNVSGLWVDEAGYVSQEAMDIAVACVREGGERGWIGCTFTPAGRSHWTYKTFGMGGADAELFCASTKVNPFLPVGFYDDLSSRYSPLLARQELEGEFLDIQGAEYPGEWFGDHAWYTDEPADYRLRVAYLDPSMGQSETSDYSAFVVLTLGTDGTLYVDADIARRDPVSVCDAALGIQGRFAPGTFGVESNGFQAVLAGMLAERSRVAGMPLPIVPVTNHTKKIERIRCYVTPFLARRELRFKRGSVGAELLVEQLRGFPEADHDDGPDALAGAIRLLQEVFYGGSRETEAEKVRF